MKDCRDCGYCQKNIDHRPFIEVETGARYGVSNFDLYCVFLNGYMSSYQAEVCPYFTTHEEREYQEEMAREFMLSDNDIPVPF